MKRFIFRASTLALLLSVLAFPAAARQVSPLLPPLSADTAGRLEIRRGETVPPEFAVAFVAAAQATDTNPAFLFALAARSKYAANAYGANAGPTRMRRSADLLPTAPRTGFGTSPCTGHKRATLSLQWRWRGCHPARLRLQIPSSGSGL